VYDTKVEYDVTLKSHLMEKDGIWIFNDLLQSKDAWIVIDGKEYKIVVDSIAVEEQSQNNIYEVTIKYKYSMPTSF
jgi:PDZ domain-containing secreted protein